MIGIRRHEFVICDRRDLLVGPFEEEKKGPQERGPKAKE